MPARGVSFTAHYLAWDFVSQVGKTGDAGNHSLRLLRDGTESVPSGSPTEIDPDGLPGFYKLTLSAAEAQASLIVVCGKSVSVGVSILPFEIVLE